MAAQPSAELPAATPAQPTAYSTSPSASASPATVTPVPKPVQTPAGAPPPPKAVRINRQGCYTGPEWDSVPSGECTTTVTWKKNVPKRTEIQVYAVTGCLSRK